MRRITVHQQGLFEKLRKLDTNLISQWDEEKGVLSSIRGKLPSIKAKKGQEAVILEAFLKEYGELFGALDLISRLQLLRSRRDDLGWTHVEYQMVHPIPKGQTTVEKIQWVDIYGSKLIAHFDAGGQLVEVQSSCWHDIQEPDEPTIDLKGLQNIILSAVEKISGFTALSQRMMELKRELFPIIKRPRLVLYSWKGRFHYCWITYAYGPREVEITGGQSTGKVLDIAQTVVDARTGEILFFAPICRGVEIPDIGTGTACTPVGGPYTIRDNELNIVNEGGTSTYRLRDTKHGHDIVTYDCNGDSKYSDLDFLTAYIIDDWLPQSEDTDGDKNWSRIATSTLDDDRTASQQPEVDAHFFCRKIYEWYNALAGSRAGWDDNNYEESKIPLKQVSVVTHAYDPSVQSVRSFNAMFYTYPMFDGGWVPFILLSDGDPTRVYQSVDRGVDYPAGSNMVLAHEYQHGITDFSFKDSDGNPGLTYDGWLGAVHEGLADAFGCMCSENWTPGPEICKSGLILRNLVYPRDSNSYENMPKPKPNGLGHHNKDHFADRDLDLSDTESAMHYNRGTILAHTAYLMAAGGVHQRTIRVPELIPVCSMGKATYGGLDAYRAARIWYYALTWYFGTLGTPSGIPTNDENTFHKLRDGCVSAAIQLYGTGSREHLTTVLAFYATGLHPADTNYGADVTFLTWGFDWWQSRPYIGINSPDWASMDLFINNGGISEWNALINIMSDGFPTQFENKIYCRVRNVGDLPANNVKVTFQFAKMGSGTTTWQDVVDKNGVSQTLNIGTLKAGKSNFPDSGQNSPPLHASVNWCIAPLAPGEIVDHFCLKATVTCSNDVNPYNNEVQSNIAYVKYSGSPKHLHFSMGNPTEEKICFNIRLTHQLPRGWKAKLIGKTQEVLLKPGQHYPLELVIQPKQGAEKQLEPPFDGAVWGKLSGPLTGGFSGTLAHVKHNKDRIEGLITGYVMDIGFLSGRFEGQVIVATSELTGRIKGAFYSVGTSERRPVSLQLDAFMRPNRRIEIAQIVQGEPIGGITAQVQVPLPLGASGLVLPPTNIFVKRTVAKLSEEKKIITKKRH
ncbi:MAG: M4 family metallopeptidase [Dehalococcoidia bacterium]